MTKTPRTDAAETNWWSEDGLRSAFIVRAEFARELERENTTLTAERDEARAQEEKFSDDALRLLIERNRALDERDEARREVCGWAGQARNLDPNVIAMQRGWNIKVKHEPDARHDRPEEVVLVKVGRHRVRENKR